MAVAEIRQNLNRPLHNPFYGCYYIHRRIDYGDNKFDAQRQELGWAEEVGLEYEYLHTDKVWRKSTKNDEGVYTGYYTSHSDAKALLNNYLGGTC